MSDRTYRARDDLRWQMFLRSLTDVQQADLSIMLDALTKKPNPEGAAFSFLESLTPKQLSEFCELWGLHQWARVH